ncbi:MAG TPA: AAA family ATPase [Acidimicrobiales bacterium]|nr:AAA family ATPase [Acidimicrobiales bacterium]
MPPATVLLLTGSPGGGKTTVAPLVADRHEPSACLDLDWFFAKVRQGFIEPWLPEAHEQNRVILRAAAETVAAFAAGGYFIVAEGILYPNMVDLFVDASAARGVELHYAVLRAPVGVVRQRVQDRRSEPEHFAALADATVVEDLWDQFERHGIAERHRVDSGDRSPGAIAAEIDRRLGAGEFRL